MYKYSFTVRTYNQLMIHCGYIPQDAAELEFLAKLVINGKWHNAGGKVATELLRAAGNGVYNIQETLSEKWSLSTETIKHYCERLDNELHKI